MRVRFPSVTQKNMDINHQNTMNQKEMLSNIITERALFMRLKECVMFLWKEYNQTIDQYLEASSLRNSQERIEELTANSNTIVKDVSQKTESKLATWGSSPLESEQYKDLNDLLANLEAETKWVKQEIDILNPDENPSDSLLKREKTTSTLLYETRSAIKRKAGAQLELDKLKKATVENKVLELKAEPDEQYSDAFDRLVCTKLDQLESDNISFPANVNRLKFAESQVTRDLETEVDLETLTKFLTNKIKNDKEKQLKRLIQRGIKYLGLTDQAVRFASIMFEVDEAKTDNVWQMNKFEQAVIRGINGEPIELVTVLCCINEISPDGKYTLVPDLNAYLSNPKLEPVPLMIDELVLIKNFFEFYNIKTSLTGYVADTDYTEIGQFGEVTEDNLANLQIYLENLQKYVSSCEEVSVRPISEITSDDQVYNQSKKRISTNIDEMSQAKITDFSREWYQKFEDAFEKITDSQAKRGIWPRNQVRQKSLEITKRAWCVNGGQGAKFGDLAQNSNIIFLSTERRERDQNYIIDKQTRKNFPPVLYFLRSIEYTARNITGKIAA